MDQHFILFAELSAHSRVLSIDGGYLRLKVFLISVALLSQSVFAI